MVKAIYKDKVLAESKNTVQVEGNHYFPRDSVKTDLLEESNLTTTCPWKGTAKYYHLKVDGDQLQDMVWYYPEPSDAAKSIENKLAFYQKNGLKVISGD